MKITGTGSIVSCMALLGSGLLGSGLLGSGCALSHAGPLPDANVDGGRDAPRLDVPRDVPPDVRLPPIDADLECDLDGDGYLSEACLGLDCDDTDPTRHRGATEICNGIDEDCDGVADDELGRFYRDVDGDGFGTEFDWVVDCTLAGYVPIAGDCDDMDPTIFPGMGVRVPTPLGPENGGLTGSLHAAPSRAPVVAWDPGYCAGGPFELQIDDSCDPHDFLACTFPSPELERTDTVPEAGPSALLPVSESAPVGRRYYWRVRACDGAGTCSVWSSVRYLDVGRVRGDYDGDGYADVVTGAPGVGEILIRRGGPGGVASDVLTIGDPSGGVGGAFGDGLASAGDLDADGFEDLAVGASGRSGERGEVYVFYGGPTGLSASNFTRITFPDAAAGEHIGTAVRRAGDVNADGYADLVVGSGVRGVSSTLSGRVSVFVGGPSGVTTTPLATFRGPIAGMQFGVDVAGADVNSDGYSDIVIASPGDRGNYVSLGSATGLMAPELAWTDDRYFAYARLFPIDVDEDRAAELVSSASPEALRGWDPTTGNIEIRNLDPLDMREVTSLSVGWDTQDARVWMGFRGSPCMWQLRTRGGWLDQPSVELCADELGWRDYRTGAGLLDVNGDGFLDYLMGLTGRDEPEGRVMVWFGPPGTASHPPDQIFISTRGRDAGFGVAFGD